MHTTTPKTPRVAGVKFALADGRNRIGLKMTMLLLHRAAIKHAEWRYAKVCRVALPLENEFAQIEHNVDKQITTAGTTYAKAPSRGHP